MLKISNYLWTYMRVLEWMLKKSTTRPICMYYNGCKQTSNYYEIYMQVLQWMKKTSNYL